MQYAWFALIGLVIGALAGQFLRGHYKIVVDMVVGAAGALLGSYLFLTYLTAFAPAKFGGYVFAAIGAFIFLLGWRALRSIE
ncbi:MAG: GlsB/YeaQ/YmgE family stress response membrane protein [Betaproteobacteria bacterium]|nr:MAG: GlsB/YeaQ/YmgE family stress response membrane protein [Betaproteobacteria bacterium]